MYIIAYIYSHLSNKRGGGAKIAKSINLEVEINVECWIFLEKKGNLKTLSILGLTKEKIGVLFSLQGLLITVFGCLGGLTLGSILLSFQNYFSILNLAPNLPYPVSFEFENFLLTFIIVILIGGIVSYSVSMLIRKNFTKSLQQ